MSIDWVANGAFWAERKFQIKVLETIARDGQEGGAQLWNQLKTSDVRIKVWPCDWPVILQHNEWVQGFKIKIVGIKEDYREQCEDF
jgi:hypothetical protein